MIIKFERDVKTCSQCPYYSESSNMGARIHICAKIGIMHTTSYNEPYDKIYNKCPFKGKELFEKLCEHWEEK